MVVHLIMNILIDSTSRRFSMIRVLNRKMKTMTTNKPKNKTTLTKYQKFYFVFFSWFFIQFEIRVSFFFSNFFLLLGQSNIEISLKKEGKNKKYYSNFFNFLFEAHCWTFISNLISNLKSL